MSFKKLVMWAESIGDALFAGRHAIACRLTPLFALGAAIMTTTWPLEPVNIIMPRHLEHFGGPAGSVSQGRDRRLTRLIAIFVTLVQAFVRAQEISMLQAGSSASTA